MNTAVYILSAIILLTACSNPSKLVSWKNTAEHHADIHEILVVSIVHDSLSAIKKEVETFYAKALKSKGYNTSTYSEEFNNIGFTKLAQEHTYIKLCEQGIDAILTIALLNEKKANKYHDKRNTKYSSPYYFKRLMNYRSIRAIPKDLVQNTSNNTALLWEVTLFNLSTLSPVYWAQTRSFLPTIANQQHVTYSKIILNNLSKQKILK